MAFVIEINGKRFSRFTHKRVTKSLEHAAGQFQLVGTISQDSVYPFKVNDICRILINDKPIINGYIETLDIDYDVNSHTITIGGRDKTSDLIDSHVPKPSATYSRVTTVPDITKAILSVLGLDGTNIFEYSPTKPFNYLDINSCRDSETAFRFIERIARKSGKILTSDGNGDLLLTIPSEKQTGIHFKNGLNIKRGSLSIDYSNKYNKYKVVGQKNLGAQTEEDPLDLDESQLME